MIPLLQLKTQLLNIPELPVIYICTLEGNNIISYESVRNLESVMDNTLSFSTLSI